MPALAGSVSQRRAMALFVGCAMTVPVTVGVPQANHYFRERLATEPSSTQSPWEWWILK